MGARFVLGRGMALHSGKRRQDRCKSALSRIIGSHCVVRGSNGGARQDWLYRLKICCASALMQKSVQLRDVEGVVEVG
jgi:hypothetical protein